MKLTTKIGTAGWYTLGCLAAVPLAALSTLYLAGIHPPAKTRTLIRTVKVAVAEPVRAAEDPHVAALILSSVINRALAAQGAYVYRVVGCRTSGGQGATSRVYGCTLIIAQPKAKKAGCFKASFRVPRPAAVAFVHPLSRVPDAACSGGGA